MHSSHAALALLVIAGFPAQVQLPKTTPAEYISLKVTSDVEEVAPGGTVELSVEIQPDRDMRVFALGASHFRPVTLVVGSHRDVSLRRPRYTVPERQKNPGDNKRVPLYDGRFTIVQPIVVSKKAKPGQVLDVVGTLTYQVCNDRIVYPEKRVMVRWTINVKELSRASSLPEPPRRFDRRL